MLCSYPNRHSKLLASLTSWGLHCPLGFIPIAFSGVLAWLPRPSFEIWGKTFLCLHLLHSSFQQNQHHMDKAKVIGQQYPGSLGPWLQHLLSVWMAECSEMTPMETVSQSPFLSRGSRDVLLKEMAYTFVHLRL